MFWVLILAGFLVMLLLRLLSTREWTIWAGLLLSAVAAIGAFALSQTSHPGVVSSTSALGYIFGPILAIIGALIALAVAGSIRRFLGRTSCLVTMGL